MCYKLHSSCKKLKSTLEEYRRRPLNIGLLESAKMSTFVGQYRVIAHNEQSASCTNCAIYNTCTSCGKWDQLRLEVNQSHSGPDAVYCLS